MAESKLIQRKCDCCGELKTVDTETIGGIGFKGWHTVLSYVAMYNAEEKHYCSKDCLIKDQSDDNECWNQRIHDDS